VLQYTEEASLAVCDGAQCVGRGEEGGDVRGWGGGGRRGCENVTK